MWGFWVLYWNSSMEKQNNKKETGKELHKSMRGTENQSNSTDWTTVSSVCTSLGLRCTPWTRQFLLNWSVSFDCKRFIVLVRESWEYYQILASALPIHIHTHIATLCCNAQVAVVLSNLEKGVGQESRAPGLLQGANKHQVILEPHKLWVRQVKSFQGGLNI